MLLNSEQKKKDLKLKKKHKFDSERFFSVADGVPLNVFVDWPTDDDFPRPLTRAVIAPSRNTTNSARA